MFSGGDDSFFFFRDMAIAKNTPKNQENTATKWWTTYISSLVFVHR